MISDDLGPPVVPTFEASIMPTSRRSEMTMMRVLLLGFTDGKNDTKGYKNKPYIHALFPSPCDLCLRYTAFRILQLVVCFTLELPDPKPT